ncbi:hypothetical protein GF359_04570 [candidate division WOR-3 bacterium]|uniref:Uncharacterized protein n=1 Tax=candidate division WOR-3 bacterium TaxID=2052148 RepID=A0A9D5QCE3_UNCW3|nr:hypothetical protein [candidate division WOR-3 bacterium]MBD3364469.1 hypothetical protein [candidate division WOR-3 bacterium]
MKSKIRILTSVFLIFMMVGCSSRLKYKAPEWKVGDWVEYEVESVQYGPRLIRYAITGVDTLHGESYYWLEMLSTISKDSTSTDTIINKMLIPYGYRGVAERMITKFAKTETFELPPGDELSWYPSDENRPYVYSSKEVEEGMISDTLISVPAGEFSCIHAQVYDIRHSKVGIIEGDSIVNRMKSDTMPVDVWVNDSIPVSGIVALRSEIEEMKLKNIGHDAKTHIIGEVKVFKSLEFE